MYCGWVNIKHGGPEGITLLILGIIRTLDDKLIYTRRLVIAMTLVPVEVRDLVW